MPPKKRYIGAILFWAGSLLVLFAVRKLAFPKVVDGQSLLYFKISASGICFVLGLIRMLDTFYNCVRGVVISVRGIRPIEVVSFQARPLQFVISFVFELFMWSMVMFMSWPLLTESVNELHG